MIALIFDTETSGLIKNHSIRLERQSSIIEFYACLVDLATGELKSELDLLIRPPGVLEAKITKITGLTNEMLAGAPAFCDVAADIKKEIESAPVVVAHNLSFDREMVDLEFERLGENVEWPRQICTVEQTLHIKGFRLSLGALHEELFGEKFVGAHRARVDVAALTRCCVELHRRGDI